MRAIFDLDGWFLLLGVPYQNSPRVISWSKKSGHTGARARWRDSSAGRTAASSLCAARRGDPTSTSPACPERSYDFNRLGEGLEQRGLVRRGAVGNAIARLFRARDLERTAREMFAANPELFFIVDGQVTPLQYGTTWPIPEGRNAGAELCVVDPAGVHQPPDR